MMKRNSFSLCALMALVFVACNKDEVIEGDIDLNPPGSQNPTEELSYDVIEYLPAPGQYINEKVAGFEFITTMQEACNQAQKRLETIQYVSLGAWGGSIVVKFKSEIVNSGDFQFAIAGNSFDSSNEPGIVWVMRDDNKNGIPDETWYELKGSYYGKEGYERNFWVTYFKPSTGEDTPWKDSNGEEGVINWMGSYHNQDYYYPNWVTKDNYTLYGSRLPSQAEQNPITGQWGNLPFDWGYVDNNGTDMIEIDIQGKKIEVNTFDINNAIDQDGNSISLKSIDFVKVQTAVLGNAGLLGENSTEVRGFFVL